MRRPHHRAAFTLIELSVVLVIVGLIVGGILGGIAFVRAGELRKVLGEHSQYSTAVSSFKTKYAALPGDMRNATRYWGAQTGGTAEGVVESCANLVRPANPYAGLPTCNGNGNGMIAEADSNADGTDDFDQFYEMYRAWQHLANAGMIDGFYIGGTDRRAWNAEPGNNVPKSAAGPDSGWILHSLPARNASAGNYFAHTKGHFLNLGSGDEAVGAGLTPYDAWNIDSKLDDGRPARGYVQAFMSTINPDCLTADSASAEYNQSYTGVACGLRIQLH